MPALVLRRQAENPLLRLVLRDQLPHPEQRLHEALADQMQQRRHLREIVRAQQLHRAQTCARHPAAVDQRPLPEHIQMPRLVHQLRPQEQLRLEELRMNLLQEPTRHIARDELHLRQERAERAHRPLNVRRQLLNRVPRNVPRRRPLPLQRLLVEQHRALRPHIRLVHVLHRVRRRARIRLRAARRPLPLPRLIPVVHPIRQLVDRRQRQPLPPRLDLQPLLRIHIQPVQVDPRHIVRGSGHRHLQSRRRRTQARAPSSRTYYQTQHTMHPPHARALAAPSEPPPLKPPPYAGGKSAPSETAPLRRGAVRF